MATVFIEQQDHDFELLGKNQVQSRLLSIPVSAKWTASHIVKLLMDAFAALYAGTFVNGVYELIDERFNIEGVSDFNSSFPNTCVAKKVPGEVCRKYIQKSRFHPSRKKFYLLLVHHSSPDRLSHQDDCHLLR